MVLIIRVFMVKRRYVILAFLLLVIGAAAALCGGVLLRRMGVWLAGFCVIAAGCGFYLKSVRCPHCGKYALRLRPFASNAGYCPRCVEFVEYF